MKDFIMKYYFKMQLTTHIEGLNLRQHNRKKNIFYYVRGKKGESKQV